MARQSHGYETEMTNHERRERHEIESAQTGHPQISQISTGRFFAQVNL